ncbi:MAG: outer membrane beta-barrel protein [Flavitalea sp.]
MKKLTALFLAFFLIYIVQAQDSTVAIPSTTDTLVNLGTDTSKPIELQINTPPAENERTTSAPTPKKMNLPLAIPTGSRDHLLIQLGIDRWSNKPDSLNIKGLSRSFNIYFMYDFPFKASPHLSIGAGIGISVSNIYFKETYIDIAGKTNSKLVFNNVGDTTHFKKYKLMTTYLEAPIELRYVADPLHPKKSWKAAAGLKFGTLLGATTKGRTLQNSAGSTILTYTEKDKSKKFFNGTRISAIGRIGYGSFSLFGSYQINPFVKQGLGPDVRPLTVGITLSGL